MAGLVQVEMTYKSPNLRKTVQTIRRDYDKPQHLLSSNFLVVQNDIIKGFSTIANILKYFTEDIQMNGFKLFHVQHIFDVRKDKELGVQVSRRVTADSVIFSVKIKNRKEQKKVI